MDDAQLDFNLRVEGVDRLRETGQPVHGGDEHVSEAAVLQFRQHRQPELGALGLGQSQDQQLLLAFQIDPQRQIDGLADHPFVLADFQYDAVQVDDRINLIQGSLRA